MILSFTHSYDTGAKSATITIANSDTDEASYTFSVIGYGASSASPEINVIQGTTNLASGSGVHDFGSVNTSGSSGTSTFTIQNLGSSNLTVSNITSSDGQFVLSALPGLPATIAAGSSATFDLTFNPAAAPGGMGIKSSTITITNDDSTVTETSYTFTAQGTGVAPTISVTPNPNPYIFVNTTTLQTSSPVSFIIENTGNKALTVNSINLIGVNATDYAQSIPTVPFSIDPLSNRTITMSFTPSAIGARNATIRINNDSGNVVNDYDVNITGSGVAPDINVVGVADGGTQAVIDSTIGTPSAPYTFTIQNTSTTKPLTINNISLSGTNVGDFSLDMTGTLMEIPASGSTTFNVIFTPGSVGAKSAVLTILNNDDPSDGDNEESYQITLNATGSGTVATPVITPATGSFGADQTVTITSATPGSQHLLHNGRRQRSGQHQKFLYRSILRERHHYPAGHCL